MKRKILTGILALSGLVLAVNAQADGALPKGYTQLLEQLNIVNKCLINYQATEAAAYLTLTSSGFSTTAVSAAALTTVGDTSGTSPQLCALYVSSATNDTSGKITVTLKTASSTNGISPLLSGVVIKMVPFVGSTKYTLGDAIQPGGISSWGVALTDGSAGHLMAVKVMDNTLNPLASIGGPLGSAVVAGTST